MASKMPIVGLMAIFVALFMSVHGSTVTINSTVSNYLGIYIPNSTVHNSTYYKSSISQDDYLIMAIAGDKGNLVVINTTKGVSLVTDNVTAFNALKPFLVSTYYPNSSTLTSLNTSMNSYITEAQPPLTDCLTETGLLHYTCNATQSLDSCLVNSCQTIPICGGAQSSPQSELSAAGTNSPFAHGIQNFSVHYTLLNNSYNDYFTVLSNVQQSNFTTQLNKLNTIVSNISKYSQSLPQNPIFPSPTNLDVTQLVSVCSGYYGYTGPWYCYSIQYCKATTFNSTKLSSIKSQVSALALLPVSNSSISKVSSNATATAEFYLAPIENKKKTIQLNAILANIYPKYNQTVLNANSLLAKLSNPNLSVALNTLTATFSSVKSNGINQNITKANLTLNALMANTSAIYAELNAIASPVYSLAQNNTARILVQELEYNHVPVSLANFASDQAEINAMLNSRPNISTVSSLEAQLQSLKSKTSFFIGPFSAGALIKAFDGAFINAMLSGSYAPISVKMTSAPTYAALESFIIGIVLIAVLYGATYFRLNKKHKIKANPRVQKAWKMLFGVIFVFVLIYAGITYVYASGATRFLPFSGFKNAIASSDTVYIAFNGTGTFNASVLSCVSTLKNELGNMGKAVNTVVLSGTSCYSGDNQSLSGAGCLNSMLTSMKPIVLIDQGSGSELVYKGLYGNIAYASGYPTYGPSCPLSLAVSG